MSVHQCGRGVMGKPHLRQVHRRAGIVGGRGVPVGADVPDESLRETDICKRREANEE